MDSGRIFKKTGEWGEFGFIVMGKAGFWAESFPCEGLYPRVFFYFTVFHSLSSSVVKNSASFDLGTTFSKLFKPMHQNIF